MRTQTLLLTAALGAVTIGSAMAQVYSVNAVGYVNVTVAAGAWKVINNPLSNQTDNTLTTLIPSAPDFSQVDVWDNAGNTWVIATYLSFAGGWNANPTLTPGKGFWFQNGGTAALTLTFVGEVMQGSPISPALTVPGGWSILGSQVPQKGLLVTDLKFPAPGDFDEVDQWGASGWVTSTMIPGAGWLPAGEPTIDVAEGFWFKNNGSAKSWSRTFTVN